MPFADNGESRVKWGVLNMKGLCCFNIGGSGLLHVDSSMPLLGS